MKNICRQIISSIILIDKWPVVLFPLNHNPILTRQKHFPLKATRSEPENWIISKPETKSNEPKPDRINLKCFPWTRTVRNHIFQSKYFSNPIRTWQKRKFFGILTRSLQDEIFSFETQSDQNMKIPFELNAKIDSKRKIKIHWTVIRFEKYRTKFLLHTPTRIWKSIRSQILIRKKVQRTVTKSKNTK